MGRSVHIAMQCEVPDNQYERRDIDHLGLCKEIIGSIQVEDRRKTVASRVERGLDCHGK